MSADAVAANQRIASFSMLTAGAFAVAARSAGFTAERSIRAPFSPVVVDPPLHRRA